MLSVQSVIQSLENFSLMDDNLEAMHYVQDVLRSKGIG